MNKPNLLRQKPVCHFHWIWVALSALVSLSAPALSWAGSAPTSSQLRALEGTWRLAAVLSPDCQTWQQRRGLDIDWTTAGASFRPLFDAGDELHAEFMGAPLSQPTGVAAGSLRIADEAEGTLQLTSQVPAPLLRTLEKLDAGLLPNAFVLAERAGEAQFVFVRAEFEEADVRATLIQQASERADMPVVATSPVP